MTTPQRMMRLVKGIIYLRFFKGPSEAAESPWTYVKDPILLKVKGHLATINSLVIELER